MIRKLGLFAVLYSLLISFELNAQMWSQFGLSSMNPYRDVAAYGGLERVSTLSIQLRSQWNNVKESPSAQYISFDTPIYIWKGSVGFDVTNQDQGVVNLKRTRLSYNYVQGSSLGLFSIGARVGWIHARVNGDRIITPEGEYESTINHNDPLLFNGIGSGSTLSWELSGVYQNTATTIGLAMSNLPFRNLSVRNSKYKLPLLINTFFRYYFDINEIIAAQVSSTIRSNLLETQTELSSILRISGNIFGGFYLRGYSSSSFDALGFVVGHSINDNLRLYYSYETGISALNSVHTGSHEILLKYGFNKLWGTGRPPRITYNPRFL